MGRIAYTRCWNQFIRLKQLIIRNMTHKKQSKCDKTLNKLMELIKNTVDFQLSWPF